MSETRWWGSFDAEVDHGLRWRIGPLHFHALRRPDAWELATHREEDPFESHVEVGSPITALPDPDEGYEVRRYGIGQAGTSLHLSPATPDRPVVARPETAFVVLPDSRVDSFVGSALWLRMQVGNGRRLMDELPISQPADTWFGPDTTEGELCYASRTSLLSRISDLPLRQHRSVTPVTIENRAASPLVLSRMRIPMPSLGLYFDGERLWTERVTLVRELSEERDLAKLSIGRPPKGAEVVASARAPASGPALIHKMNAFLGF